MIYPRYRVGLGWAGLAWDTALLWVCKGDLDMTLMGAYKQLSYEISCMVVLALSSARGGWGPMVISLENITHTSILAFAARFVDSSHWSDTMLAVFLAGW